MKRNKEAITFGLLSRGWLTALESALQGGCLALSQRVGEWKKDGHKIADKWVTLKIVARVKAYKLVRAKA